MFIALFRAKQYLQISADSLLGKDKRAPILFLRSFSDDPKVNAAATPQSITTAKTPMRRARADFVLVCTPLVVALSLFDASDVVRIRSM